MYTDVVITVVLALRTDGPLPAKCWPEAFHATFIHNIQRKRGWQDKKEEKQRYHYQYHHNYLPPPPLAPPNSYRARGGGRTEGRKNLRNSVTLSFMLI